MKPEQPIKPCRNGHTEERYPNRTCKVCVREKRVAQRPEIKEYSKAYRTANKEKYLEYMREWRAKHPEAAAIKRHNRRAADTRTGFTGGQIKILKSIQKFCAGCGVEFCKENPATIDHKRPLNKNGTNSIFNLQLLCGPCNFSKGVTLDGDWRASKSGSTFCSITGIRTAEAA